MISDEALAHQLQQGEQTALTMLVDRHYDALLGYLYRMTGGDRPLAEDMVQEAFMRLLNSIRQYDTARPFKPWLYAIATNLARNHAKRSDTRHTVAVDEDSDAVDDAWDAPEAALLAADEVQTVIAALASLTPEQREVIVLYYYQSLEGAEIAAALGIPLGTVRSRLATGVHRLRRWMEAKAL